MEHHSVYYVYVHWATVLILCIAAATLMFTASLIYQSLVDELNLQLPADRRIRAGNNTKVFQVLRQHAQLFPRNQKRNLFFCLATSGIIALLAFFSTAILLFGAAQ